MSLFWVFLLAPCCVWFGVFQPCVIQFSFALCLEFPKHVPMHAKFSFYSGFVGPSCFKDSPLLHNSELVGGTVKSRAIAAFEEIFFIPSALGQLWACWKAVASMAIAAVEENFLLNTICSWTIVSLLGNCEAEGNCCCIGKGVFPGVGCGLGFSFSCADLQVLTLEALP